MPSTKVVYIFLEGKLLCVINVTDITNFGNGGIFFFLPFLLGSVEVLGGVGFCLK